MPRQNETNTPIYIGCIPRAAGRPTLLFSSGLLVQDDQDPTQVGWYAFAHPNLLLTHVNEDVHDAFVMSLMTPGVLDQAYRIVMNQFLAEAHDAFQGNAVVPAANQTSLVVVDIDDVDNGQAGSFYLFGSRLVRANDPHLPAAWHLPQAMQALGPLDANGQPTRPAHHAAVRGVTRFA